MEEGRRLRNMSLGVSKGNAPVFITVGVAGK
jgi:hypothetical protein